jgi:hypothetical protein
MYSMKQINLRLPEALLEKVDDARGLIPRDRWLRDLVERHFQPNAETILALPKATRAAEPEPAQSYYRQGHPFKAGKSDMRCVCGKPIGAH